MMKRKKELLFAVFFGLVVAVIVYAASQTVLYWPFLNIQNKIDDSNFIRRFMLKGSDGTGTDNIVIVDIGDSTISNLGSIKSRRWPRRHLAKVIGHLKRDGARLIFLDIILQGWTRDNKELADSTKSAGNVIAGYYFNLDAQSKNRRPPDPVYNEQFSVNLLSQQSLEKNQFIKANDVVLPYYGLLGSVKALGFANYIPDPDGILRHIPLYIAYGKSGRLVSPSASLQMWLNLKGVHYSESGITPEGIRFGKTFIPTDKHCFMRLNYIASKPVYPYVSFMDVLDGNFKPGSFTGKTVLIGSSSEKIGDLKRIPGYGSLPGVEIHAAALSTILNEKFLTVVSGNIILVICLVCGVLSSVIFNFAHPVKTGMPVAVCVPLAMYIYSIYLFVAHSTLINISIPSFIILLLYIVIVIHRFMEQFEVRSQKSEVGSLE